ncbi:polysaccharide deacetylase [Candidatus Koribacter versatilis Ellin345]|uniref:Polysaccharide deacetylase n=1 Tax=Koribacter versatilis (strain Ellin345) TaxID=204669 RepID=Q1IV08_KORVE|nr:polysaccharide deacetylase family protein [Candidatus Koribacter versatilis]ABF39292.1 polysaccharide deacetylase [Candidatus Koribacter versatilis Ellin345]
MKLLRLLCLALLLAAPVFAQAPVAQQMDTIVAAYRQIIVLTDGEASLDQINRDRVAIIGEAMFEENHLRIAALNGSLIGSDGKPASVPITEFLTRVESNGDYRDADKLVFRDTFDELQDIVGQLPPELKKRVTDDIAALDQIQALYQKEISATFGKFATRAMPVRREAWTKYVEFLKTKYARERILKEHDATLPPTETRGAIKAKRRDEIFGTELPPKTILLTFDDGPHPKYTDQVLEILKAHNIQGVFFEVGKNLGTVDDKGEVKLTPTAKAAYRVLEHGSAIGNHSYSHPVLPKLDAAKQTEEIQSTNKLIAYVQKSDPTVFRPPYGAVNDAVLKVSEGDKLKAMIWNIDSMDWADPVPSSIVQRVLDEVKKQGRGIILFHDIHKQVISVLPTLIDELEKDGYTFASWNGTEVTTGMRGTQVASEPPPVQSMYHDSWAAVIGIDDYKNWPKLRYAANDATAVRDVLVDKYKFKPDHVFLLTNEQATRQNILSLLGDKLGNPDMVNKDDRVFVFFAGHGATRKLASGRELGYIIPVEADLSSYEGQAISMTNFQDIAEAIPAKHLLFVMDSCYSGLALTRGAPMANSQNYLQEIARREARQMFTAGGADQQVADGGPNGHSVFTWTLLQALDGRADLNGDGVITASELATYVSPAVSALSQQTPSFGNLPGSQGGDFIFELKHESEFLESNSTQLNDDAIRLNSEIEKLRVANDEKERQNEQLRQEIAALKAGKETVAMVTRGAAEPSSPKSAFALNDEGMRLYKEKKYEEALAKFKEAAELAPTNALFANNTGFAFFRLAKYAEAAEWYQKSITIDPSRAIAYVNLGDADLKVDKRDDALKAFQKYLELMPNGKSAEYVRAKVSELQGK